ncbi:Uma2 family endonuclease [Actinoplanes sp. NPDC023801]|uniref:Uma2 family endonuclease n=1 Tax=Actinoplanes sp. NPDC023801 TaxID=3154595 RepID=UPI0033E849F3
MLTAMTEFNPSLLLNLSSIENLDVDDLISLPKGFRYELHNGNLVVMTPSTFWHKEMTGRLYFMLRLAGLRVFQDPGVRGARPRDLRLPDVGVVTHLPAGMTNYSNLSPSAYSLVVEVVSKNSPNGEFLEKKLWYAEHGIPEYWIVEETPDACDDDGVVTIMRLDETGDEPDYPKERTLLVSELEAEYRAGQA